MDYIRWLHPRHFYQQHGRFGSNAFRNLGPKDSKSLSLVECECVVATGLTFCDHARKYYLETNTVSEPPIYWRFPYETVLPPPGKIEPTPTATGDKCHRNIYGISDDILRSRFLYIDPASKTLRPLSEFMICAQDDDKPLSLSDMTTIQNQTGNSA